MFRVSISSPHIQTFTPPKIWSHSSTKSIDHFKFKNTFNALSLIQKSEFHTTNVSFAVPKRKPSLRVRRIRWDSQAQKPQHGFHPCKACGTVLRHRNMICGVGCKAREFPSLTTQQKALITIERLKESGFAIPSERPKTATQKELEKYLITPPRAVPSRKGPWIASSTAKYRLAKIFEINKLDEDED